VKQFPSDIAKAAGLVEALSGAGMVAGPALGSAFYAIGGFAAPFNFCRSVSFISCFLVFQLIPDSVETIDRNFSVKRKVTYW